MRRVLLLGMGMFVLGTDAYLVAGLVPMVATDFDTSIAVSGQMMTVYALAYAFVAPPVAGMLSRYGARTLLLSGMGLVAFGNLLTVLTGPMEMLLVARAVVGVGQGIFVPLAATAVTSLVPPERLSQGLAVVLGGLATGTLVGIPCGLLLTGASSWRNAAWFTGALSVLVLVLLRTGLPPIDVGRPPSLRARAAVLRERRIVPVVATSFCQAVASIGLYTYLLSVIRDSSGAPNGIAVLWVWGFGGVLGTVVVGGVVARLRPATVITGLVCGMTAALGVLPVLSTTEVGIVAALVIWGVTGWAFVLPLQLMLLTLRPTDGGPEHGGPVYGLNSSVTYFGNAVGAALGGLLLVSGIPARELPWILGCFGGVALVLHTVVPRLVPGTRNLTETERPSLEND